MTIEEQKTINSMRLDGYGYKRIASQVGLPPNTVKSYLRRHPVATHTCLQCGGELVLTPGKRERKFCSDACRMAWWRDHPDRVQYNHPHSFVCRHCGRTFDSRRPTGLYCSMACYNAARAEGVKS